MNTRQTKLVREGPYVAEVDVDLIRCDAPWAPYLSREDARKLDRIRQALQADDLAAALQLGRVYRLTPVSAS